MDLLVVILRMQEVDVYLANSRQVGHSLITVFQAGQGQSRGSRKSDDVQTASDAVTSLHLSRLCTACFPLDS